MLISYKRNQIVWILEEDINLRQSDGYEKKMVSCLQVEEDLIWVETNFEAVVKEVRWINAWDKVFEKWSCSLLLLHEDWLRQYYFLVICCLYADSGDHFSWGEQFEEAVVKEILKKRWP